MEKIVFSWSTGKDSALALYKILKEGKFEVVSLLTILGKEYDRVSMHGVRRTLLEEQAKAVGLPLEEVFLSSTASNEEYENQMESVLTRFKEIGVSSVAFGDIFLEDLRRYRENNLAKVGMKGIFPNWGRNTTGLISELLDKGFKAVITCVDGRVLNPEFAGRMIDDSFLSALPPNIDPCGENGEYHSFVFEGPIFKNKLAIRTGEVIQRESFYFCDLIPQS